MNKSLTSNEQKYRFKVWHNPLLYRNPVAPSCSSTIIAGITFFCKFGGDQGINNGEKDFVSFVHLLPALPRAGSGSAVTLFARLSDWFSLTKLLYDCYSFFVPFMCVTSLPCASPSLDIGTSSKQWDFNPTHEQDICRFNRVYENYIDTRVSHV